MNIFHSAIENSEGFLELKRAVLNGICPCAVTGVSAIHKAQLVLSTAETLPKGTTLLVITEDEQTARRFADDLNELNGSKMAMVFPAKDIVLTRVESVSSEI